MHQVCVLYMLKHVKSLSKQVCGGVVTLLNPTLFSRRLLTMGLMLLQSDILPNTMAKSVLRERIYAASLDYFRWKWVYFRKHLHWRNCIVLEVFLIFCVSTFSVMPTYPTQRGIELRDDILSLVKFWHVMHSDKKYMKTSDVILPGESAVTPFCGLLQLNCPRHSLIVLLMLLHSLGLSLLFVLLCNVRWHWKWRWSKSEHIHSAGRVSKW